MVHNIPMTRNIGLRLGAALVLLVTGALLWARGRDADRRAEAERALVTLQYGRAIDAAATSAAARYWIGDYAAVDASDHPLLAANAAYRAAVARGGSAKEMVTRLDDVVKRYAEALRNDPGNEDAAFNYEFVVRYRAAIAARGVAIPPVEDDGSLTPHGRAGAPPKGTSQQQFKMLVPMRPEERREAEEAGKTGRRIRKG
jgi:hypothetical protein